jgi:hypothetical protein
MTHPVAIKIFLTCWSIFVLHTATDIVREHYLAFSIAEDYSFRVDKYLGLHVDIFETPGYGAHIGNNPGASMIGAIPYWVCRPAIEFVVAKVSARRAASGGPVTAVYDDPRPRRVEFYRQVRERGLDIRFGLAAGVMQVFAMAPLSALAAIVMWRLLVAAGLAQATSTLLALLYALGTPIFFRTAFLNQNLIIAHLVLFGFVLLWRPGGWPAWSHARSSLAAGFLGGFAVLSDYSGLVALAWLGLYGLWRAFQAGRWREAAVFSLRYAAGAAGPVALLLFYQWRSFGSPWYPGQHYMPPVEWIEVGYRGVGGPQLELFTMLLVDPRFGLFVVCPLLALGVPGVVQLWRRPGWLPRGEAAFLAAFVAAMVLFFSAVQYSRLQYVTGVRYLVPVIPCLFLLAVPVLLRLPAPLRYVLVVLAFGQAWCLSMARATSVIESIERVLLGGFQLPWMVTLSKMAPQYFPFMASQASPLPLFALCGALLYGLWRSDSSS